MKLKSTLIGVAAAVAGVLAGCGHDHSDSGMTNTPPPPPPPTNTAVSVSTAGLLENYAREPSETATPLPVNDGAFTLTDTSDTSTPISTN